MPSLSRKALSPIITVTVTITSEFRTLIFPHVIYYMNSEVMVTVTVIIFLVLKLFPEHHTSGPLASRSGRL